VLATQQINKGIAGRVSASPCASGCLLLFCRLMPPFMIDPLAGGLITPGSLLCPFIIQADYCVPSCSHMRTGRSRYYTDKSIDASEKVGSIGYGSNHSFFSRYYWFSYSEFLFSKRTSANRHLADIGYRK